MDVQLPDWIEEGGRVAVEGGSAWIQYDVETVERITATQVVLVDGRRFRKADLGQVGTGRGKLVCVADESVKRYRVKRQIQEYAMKVEEIAKELRNSRQLDNDEALNRIGAAQRQMEKMIYRINENRFS